MVYTILVGSFQPFESRIGQDTVISLRFPYDPELVARLKTCLRHYKDQAMDPSSHIFNAGGWRPQEQCWYVERSVWPLVQADLRAWGYAMKMVDEAPHG